MTPEEVDIEKAQIEAEIKRYEIRAGVWKVALGTALVGIAAAFFPFAQQYATVYFSVKIETMKQQAALDTALREAQLTGTTLNRKFLDSIAEEGRSSNLDERIVLAEYYAYLSDQGEERIRWEGFLKHLYDLREQKRAAVVDAITKATNEKSTATEIAVAQAQARLLVESAASVQSAPYSMSTLDIQSLINLLDDDSDAIRQRAQKALGDRGLVIVRPVMAELRTGSHSKAKRLGLLIALTEMMRKNKSNRRQISSLLTIDDLEVLLEYAIDQNRMVHIHAAEFLYDLGDPEIFNATLALWNDSTTDSGKFNLALVLKGLAPFVPGNKQREFQSKLTSLLGSVGPKTDKLLKDAISLMN
ncbi:hypothetical protein [Pseudoalteromonas obscura]|uniref:HEAT repeat domain-containing protein n=1 Tax=Pseudoalteromonas obscura TaxID=3048491 RepID=A0ABT7EQU0_9GAMM|nr:hypothetical protein [Pseudoalteromonas sp. P94(2023)]MDK2597429.1 hypothetical protein [Pseudoalteromonas sp. P94(2023)]